MKPSPYKRKSQVFVGACWQELRLRRMKKSPGCIYWNPAQNVRNEFWNFRVGDGDTHSILIYIVFLFCFFARVLFRLLSGSFSYEEWMRSECFFFAIPRQIISHFFFFSKCLVKTFLENSLFSREAIFVVVFLTAVALFGVYFLLLLFTCFSLFEDGLN